MKVSRPLLKLPRRYCAQTLSNEIAALPPSAWLPHPGRVAGNDAVPLVTPYGEITNGFAGPMAPTPHLQACPYIFQIMEDLGGVWGRSRLMGLSPGAIVPEHVDVGHYWRTHLRIHIPIITNPHVAFTCAGETVNMEAGECWIFDSFRIHDVRNGGTAKRVHLVLDTVGSEQLWELMAQAESDACSELFIGPSEVAPSALRYEKLNAPAVMSVWEMRCHTDFLLGQLDRNAIPRQVHLAVDRLLHSWGALWSEYGADPVALPAYRKLIDSARNELQQAQASRVILPNRVALDRAMNELVFMAAAAGSSSPVAQRAAGNTE